VAVDPTCNPFHTRNTIYPDKVPTNWESLYEGMRNEKPTPNIPAFQEDPLFAEPEILKSEDVESCPLWQYNGKYILVPSANGLVLINQHRAHSAVLYAQFMEQLAHTQGATQQLLFPEVLALPKDEMVLVNTMLGDLRAIGFDIEQLSPDSYSIQGVPAQIANMSAVPILQDIILQVRDRDADTQAEWREQIAMSLANNAAIPYGKILTEEEVRDILTRLVQTANYRRLPNGKTIVSLLSDEEIGKRF
jgi:DNA mismatch repair protein MutL